jgi:hypothetical protein
VRSFLWKAIPVAIYILSVAIQIFGPRPIGVADNNDFAKVLGRLGIWVAPGFRGDLYRYFVTDYRIAEKNIWTSELLSTEVWIARAAKALSSPFMPPGRFDIRILGGLHATFAVCAFALFLLPLGAWPWQSRAFFTLLFLLIFSDVEYVQFFSTAYMDAASLVFLMLVFAVSWNVVIGRQKTSWQWGLAFCLFAMLFLGSKVANQPYAIPLAFFSWTVARWAPNRAGRIAWLATPAVLLAGAYFMISRTPVEYQAEPLFSLVFDKLLPLSQRPEQVLLELHRPPAELQYNHTDAYSPGTPLADPQYRAEFSHEVTTRNILAFYVHHPGIGFEILSSDFRSYAPDIPVGNFGTMRRADNPEPVFRANGLRIWSTFRSWSCLRWPWHIPLLYLAVGLYGHFGRDRFSGMWLLGLTICTIGCLSFAIGSLGDAEETSRHIVLFQEATDMLFVIALAVSSPTAFVRHDRSPPPSSGAFAPLT